jgi:hypothetical protein
MIDVNSQWKSLTDREKWAARGGSFVAKVKATRAVWFPPAPVEVGRKAASTAKKSTKRASRKTAGAARKSAGSATRSTGAAKKRTAKGTGKVTSPVRRNKS